MASNDLSTGGNLAASASRVYWWGIAALFCLTYVIVWFGRHKTSNANLAEESQNRNNALQGRPKIDFSEEWERLDYIALRDKGYACSQTFTPLQMEALTLSRDLGKFLDDAEPFPAVPVNPSFDDAYDHYRGKGYDWGIRFRAKYDAQFSARIKEFVSHLEIERARVNSILRGGFEGIHTMEMIEKIRGELWRETMYAADVDFDKDCRHEA